MPNPPSRSDGRWFMISFPGGRVPPPRLKVDSRSPTSRATSLSKNARSDHHGAHRPAGRSRSGLGAGHGPGGHQAGSGPGAHQGPGLGRFRGQGPGHGGRSEDDHLLDGSVPPDGAEAGQSGRHLRAGRAAGRLPGHGSEREFPDAGRTARSLVPRRLRGRVAADGEGRHGGGVGSRLRRIWRGRPRV